MKCGAGRECVTLDGKNRFILQELNLRSSERMLKYIWGYTHLIQNLTTVTARVETKIKVRFRPVLYKLRITFDVVNSYTPKEVRR